MSYDSYKAYLTISTSPSETYKNDLQAMIDDQFDNSSSYYTIQEETSIGSGSYQNINVRINHIVNNSTGVKLGDDFKEIIFQDMDHVRALGMMYYFDSNYWVTINSDYYHYVTASTVIRRCNNVLKWIEDGVVYTEPCAIDYGMSYDSADWNKIISLPDGEIRVICQSNVRTQTLGVDDRFLFGSKQHSYKIIRTDSLRNLTTLGNDAPLIEFKCQLMQLESDDNTTLGIANYYDTVYTLNILESSFQNILSYSTTLHAEVKQGDTLISPTPSLTWTSSDATIVSVTSGGVISCLKVGSATITVKMTNNALVYDAVTVSVVASPAGTKQIIISPLVTRLIQGTAAQVYSVYQYIDGAVQASTFTFTVSGSALSSHYIFTAIDDNHFSIQNLYKDSNEIHVLCECISDGSSQSLDVELSGLW